MLGNILKALFRLFCGPGSASEPPQQGQSYSHPADNTIGDHKPSPSPQKYQDDNQINQSNQQYKALRAHATEEGNKMAKCFEGSHQAYSQGNGALAKELSNQGKEHQRTMEACNKQASNWIFKENNKDSKPGEIDLHGLYVKEAIARTEEALEVARRDGGSELKLIVGKGLHSQSGAKIKPAIEHLMKTYQLDAELDTNNSGVLVVRLNTAAGHMGPEEISRRLERNDESCVIM